MLTPTWQTYFYFSKKELKGIIVLGIILTGSVLLSMIFSTPSSTHKISSLKASKPIHLINFDPNQIDSEQAINLGIPNKQVRSMLHYREKGGYFKSPDDFAKLYGLKNDLFILLRPYINIAPTHDRMNRVYTKSYSSKANEEVAVGWKLDINNADETEWLSKTKLPINIVHRILSYRNYIGNFSNSYQLNKVYGITDSTLQQLKGHVYVQPGTKVILNANAMNFKDWKQLGLFTDQQVWTILRLKKENEGKIRWARLVEACDLTQNEAMLLKQRIRFIE
jgi:DNA uptake protein ComE-like DNA-binding protein